MESTALTARLPVPFSRSRSKLLSPSPFAGARRLASVPLTSSSGRVFLLSRGRCEYAGVGSSVFAAAAASGEATDAGAEVILLSVQGMMCDGCAASVKRILESQPEVTSATVDFKQASAVVWTTAEAKASEDWRKQCGEKFAKHLGTCGFESSLQESTLEVDEVVHREGDELDLDNDDLLDDHDQNGDHEMEEADEKSADLSEPAAGGSLSQTELGTKAPNSNQMTPSEEIILVDDAVDMVVNSFLEEISSKVMNEEMEAVVVPSSLDADQVAEGEMAREPANSVAFFSVPLEPHVKVAPLPAVVAATMESAVEVPASSNMPVLLAVLADKVPTNFEIHTESQNLVQVSSQQCVIKQQCQVTKLQGKAVESKNMADRTGVQGKWHKFGKKQLDAEVTDGKAPLLRRSHRSMAKNDDHTLKKTERMAAIRNLEALGNFQGDLLAAVLGAATA